MMFSLVVVVIWVMCGMYWFSLIIVRLMMVFMLWVLSLFSWVMVLVICLFLLF